jgi:hypothetical protein
MVLENGTREVVERIVLPKKLAYKGRYLLKSIGV